MTVARSIGLVPGVVLFASVLPFATAQTTTLRGATGIPASCTPLATLLSEYPPPIDGKVVDDALNDGLQAFYSNYEEAKTKKTSVVLDHATICDYIISTFVPSATPSATPALSSYVSAAGIWLEDHGLDNAESLLDGECARVVEIEDELARGALDFVIGFGQCYTLLGWDKRASTGSGATTISTTDASSTPTATPAATPSASGSAQVTPSPTGQASEEDATPPSAGNRRVADAFWALGATACAILLLS